VVIGIIEEMIEEKDQIDNLMKKDMID